MASVAEMSDAIDLIGTVTYTVTRKAAPSLVKGKRVAGTTSALTIEALVHPVAGRELQRLPEGLRSREVISIFSKTELRTVQVVAGAETACEADSIRYQGRDYEIQVVEPWDETGGFFRYYASKLGR
jgi:hypothetical protein